MQTKEEIEQFYSVKDPWGYENNPEDARRKKMILTVLREFAERQHPIIGMFSNALDIGAGEGWITQDLPAGDIHAIEWSDTAANRFPYVVTRVEKPLGKYELITAMGVLYAQYDHKQILDWIKNYASGYVLTCNISDWEINDLPREKIVWESYFPYREYTEHIVLYDFSTR